MGATGPGTVLGMSDDPMTLTARGPEDVLAMVPVVLGFVPEDSLVMLTFGAAQSFHARVDLPPDSAALREVVDALLDPAVRHGVRRVLLVAYTPDLRLAERVTGRVRDAFERRRIEVIGRLVADGRCWWPLPREEGAPGTPYDVSAHRFAAEAVLRGLVTHGSRADLSATLAAVPEAVAEVTRALAGRSGPDQPVAEAGWAAATVRRCVADGTTLPAGDTARLLTGLRDLSVRDAAWTTLTRADAVRHVALLDRRRPAQPHLPRRGAGRSARLRRVGVGAGSAGVVRRGPVPRGRPRLPPRRAARRQPCRRAATVRVGRRAGGIGPRTPGLRADRATRVGAWEKRSRHRSSRAPIAPGTGRRCAAASTCSPGCCARRASTPTTR